jgi:hypothetical protein
MNAVVFSIEITMKFHYVNGLPTAGSTSHISKSFLHLQTPFCFTTEHFEILLLSTRKRLSSARAEHSWGWR